MSTKTYLRNCAATLLILAAFHIPTVNAASTSAHQATPSTAQRWGTHGLALFGGSDALYASHLPMFHAPHDVQMIIRFHVSDTATDRAIRNALNSTPELWTIDPEEFDLDRLAPGHPDPLKSFNARIVQGHFERGGKERFTMQTLIIDEVLFFHHLSGETRQHSEGRYLVIGKTKPRFLVKKIDRRPDFDLIVLLNSSRDSMHDGWDHMPTEILLPSENLLAPSQHAWRRALTKQLGKKVDVGSVLYFETGDLR